MRASNEPRRGEPGRQRPQIPGSRWRDLFDHLQPQSAILLFSEDAGRRGCVDPLLRLGARRTAAVFAHTGFDDPESPADAPPRESIEARTLVFFPPGA